MKSLLTVLAFSFCALSSGSAQDYEAQYPYDPYSAEPQAQTSPQYYQGDKSSSQVNQGYDNRGYETQSHGSGDYSSLLNYNSLEAFYAYNDFKGDDRLKGDSGFGIDLKVQLMTPLFLHLGLERIYSETPQAEKLEVTTLTAAAGVYLPITSRFHIFGELGVRYDYTGGDLEEIVTDEFGVFVRAGLRFAVTEKLEVAASVLFNTTDNLNDNVIELNAYYALLSWLDIGVGVDFGSDINSYHAGGRWRW